MTNKEIIRKVNEGFTEGNNEKILLYVAEDVTWEMPGAFNHKGKDSFRKELDNENFIGPVGIKIKNELEDGDKIAVEGEVQCKKKDGSLFDALFFDFYRLKDGKIEEMRSYVIEKK